MKNVKEAFHKMKMAQAEFEKAMTMYEGEKVEKNQDGNRGNTTHGEQGFHDGGDFDNLSKKQIFKQKLMAGLK